MRTNEHITVLGDNGDQSTAWEPDLGEEAIAAGGRTRLDADSCQHVLQTSAGILSQCVSPRTRAGSRTGLVVGYVQSGKTLSFTTVTALANDNGFGIVIVIAGMTNELSKQSHQRLLAALGVDEPFSRWADFFEPTIESCSAIRNVLMEAREEESEQGERRTVLITLKKNHAHLRNLANVFAALGDAVHVPTLIIDDEADQASLNTLVKDGDLSTTYKRILDLRALLPQHTFLQYTATPQAPILINLIDILSPDFAILLNPGPGYVGGRKFFSDNAEQIVDIPPNEIPTKENEIREPPESLLYALRLFFVGVASGLIRWGLKSPNRGPSNRSMMVHPARETISHKQYHIWVEAIRTLWIDMLFLPETDPDRRQLLEEFRTAHANLSRTVDDLETFEQISGYLRSAIRKTDVRLVNSLADADRDIKWTRTYPWILVGGQVLDRGFTVEGLTVTYMPRGPGVGNADTIQQRARFLGYKQAYLGYCRVFLEPAVTSLYTAYVRHEEDMRRSLLAHIDSGQPLSKFRRVFLLDRKFRPTRQSVIDIDYTQPKFRAGWCWPRQPHNVNVKENQRVVGAFWERHGEAFVRDEGHRERLPYHKHLIARDFPLSVVYDELLTCLEVNIEDSENWTLALILIDRYVSDNPDGTCSIYRMRPDVPTPERGLANDRIENLFQGAYPVSTRDVYAGDRALRDAPVTVQLHTVTLRTRQQTERVVVAENVECAAIWMAPQVCQDLIVQRQGED